MGGFGRRQPPTPRCDVDDSVEVDLGVWKTAVVGQVDMCRAVSVVLVTFVLVDTPDLFVKVHCAEVEGIFRRPTLR